MDGFRASIQRLIGALPRGRMLPDPEWESRHRAMLWLLAVHVAGLLAFLLAQGFGPWGSIRPLLPIAALGLAARFRSVVRRWRAVLMVFALLSCSAVLVMAWHGQTEAHFHFFVMIVLLTLYEDWVPFGVAIVYVVVEHGLMSMLGSHMVFNHGGNPWLWALAHAAFVLGQCAACVAMWRINENTRVRMNDAHVQVRNAAEQFRVAFEGGLAGMAMLDPQGRFIRVNRAMCEMLGYGEDELLGRGPGMFTHPDDVQDSLENVQSMLRGDTDTYETEKRYITASGDEVWARVGARSVRAVDGQVRYLLTQVSDITARKRYEQRLAHSALHDSLTGLPNRELFLDRLRHSLTALLRGNDSLAVLFVDLDRFKLVNDTMGHAVGDAVLVQAAARLDESIRAGDTVARFGGDEFTILCPGADEAEANRVAERILRALGHPFTVGSRTFRLSGSVGIRIGDEAGLDAEELIADADYALLSAKEHGRARRAVFGAGVRRPAQDPLAAEQELRTALERGELELHYQPEVDLATGRIIAVEGLLRWPHPERGMVPPSDFIPLAEQSDLILRVGAWVIREGYQQLAQWRAAGVVDDTFRIALNVSARQLSLHGLVETVLAASLAAGVEPGGVTLEITETALADDSEMALITLERLRALGVTVALDDFGVGFSSLSRIRDLPAIDVIKIDRSFVAGFAESGPDAAVVQAVLSLAGSLGVTTVAEGIETVEQLHRLTALGCVAGQGFLLARPAPSAAVTELLAGRSLVLA